MPILTGRRPRPWTLPTGGRGAFSSEGYYLGPGSVPLEVAVATTPAKPTESDVRNLWKRRKSNQPSPLLLVVLWSSANGQRATACGVVGDDPAVYSDRDPGQISRLADLALAEPDHHAAVRFLSAYLPEETGALRNVALFASHHLTGRVPQRSDWADLCQQGAKLWGYAGNSSSRPLASPSKRKAKRPFSGRRGMPALSRCSSMTLTTRISERRGSMA